MNVRIHATMPDTKSAAGKKQAANIIAIDVLVDETMAFTICLDIDRAAVMRDDKYLADFIAKHVSEKVKAAFPGFMKVTTRHEKGYDFEDSIYFNKDVRWAG